MRKYKTSAIILAGGTGSRMNSGRAKQYMTLLGKTVIERSVFAFDQCELIDEIVVVIRDGDDAYVTELLSSSEYKKPITKP